MLLCIGTSRMHSIVITRRCADSADSQSNIDLAMEWNKATRGTTLTQSKLNTQGGNSVVAILDLEMRTEVVKGPCKLLRNVSIKGPKLVSRLLLIW